MAAAIRSTLSSRPFRSTELDDTEYPAPEVTEEAVQHRFSMMSAGTESQPWPSAYQNGTSRNPFVV